MCRNTKDMLHVDALKIYPLLRQMKWNMSQTDLSKIVCLLFEMEVPLSFLLCLEHLLNTLTQTPSRSFLKIEEKKKEEDDIIDNLLGSIVLLRSILRTVLDGCTDDEIEELVECVKRFLVSQKSTW